VRSSASIFPSFFAITHLLTGESAAASRLP
jgi:hypothetical protein